MVPAQVQQRPAKSTALPLPRTNPVPEVATTSMLDRRKNESKRQVPKHEFKYHPFIKLKKKRKRKKWYSASNTITMHSIWYAHNHLSELFIQPAGTTRAYMGKRRPTPETKNGSNSMKKGSSTHCDPIWPYREGLIFETGSGLRSLLAVFQSQPN